MNVALFGTYNSKDTGPSRVTEGLSRGLANRGIDVIMLAHGDRTTTPQRGIDVVDLGETPTTVRGFLNLQRRVSNTVSEYDPDVFHPLEEYYGPADVRTVQWTSDIWERHVRGLEGVGIWPLFFDGVINFAGIIGCIRDGDATLVASSPETERQMNDYWRISPDTVIPLAVNKLELTPPETQEGSTQVLFPGRVTYKKGQERVLKHLRPDSDEYNVEIVGSVSNQKYVSKLAEWRDHLHGFVDRAELYGYYRKSDIVVVPSYHENFSMVALEAIAKGCVVVITAVCGIAKFDWANPENGIYVVEDGEEAAETVKTLAKQHLDEEKRRAYRFAKQLTWESIADTYIELYEDQMS